METSGAYLPATPAGSRSLHAFRSRVNAALLGSTDEPFAIPSMVTSPDARGSGNALIPLARMHWAKATAFSCAVPLRAVAAVPSPPRLPEPAEGFEQPATIRASMARV